MYDIAIFVFFIYLIVIELIMYQLVFYWYFYLLVVLFFSIHVEKFCCWAFILGVFFSPSFFSSCTVLTLFNGSRFQVCII